jgi:hypothetical protein
MSELHGSPYSGTSSEAADNGRGVTQARAAGSEIADAPPAEPMSRQQYADHMRQGPAAGADSQARRGDDHDVAVSGQGGDARREPREADPAGQAQGMSRGEYADYMRRGAAAGSDDPGPAGRSDNDPGNEPGGDGNGEAESQTGQRPTDSPDPRATSTAGDQPVPTGRDLASADRRLAPQEQATAERGTGADPPRPVSTETPAEDVGTFP